MTETCPGCGARMTPTEGPVHGDIVSSPACFAAFNALLAAERGDPGLLQFRRLSVDTWAAQHPGDPADPRAVQSTGLHLARLMLQLDRPRPPQETNAAMLEVTRHKASLPVLTPPRRFSVTVGEISPLAGTPYHSEAVRGWASATWADWAHQHEVIRSWVRDHTGC